MAAPKLRLLLHGQKCFDCELSTRRKMLTAEEILRINRSVIADGCYTFELFDFDTSEQISMSINGVDVITNNLVKDNKLELIPTYSFLSKYNFDKPFADFFGFIQIEIIIGSQSWFSEFLQILLPENEFTNDLKAMARYVANNQDALLVTDSPSLSFTNSPNPDSDPPDTLATLNKTLETIIHVYERHIGYFKGHAETKLIQIQKRDNFEKIKNFSGHTLSSILQNPGELIPVTYSTGLTDGWHYYQPLHALVADNVQSRDTYENSVILSFLSHISQKIILVLNDVQNLLDQDLYESKIQGYISSIDAIWTSLHGRLSNEIEHLKNIKTKIEQLLVIYRRLLPVKEMQIISMPQANQVFLRVPTYRLFFELIGQWFSLPQFNLKKEILIFTFLLNSRLYEYFVLLSEINAIISQGFKPVRNSKFDWSLTEKNIIPEDDFFANTFTFIKEDTTVTLYFQPVVGGHQQIDDNGVELRRITTLKYNSEARGGYYYRPDYIIKVQNSSSAEYTILDAKYSKYEVVRSQYAAELAFKYLMSIRCCKNTDQLRGLHVYYGKRSLAKNSVKSFWNLLDDDVANQSKPFFTAEGRFPI